MNSLNNKNNSSSSGGSSSSNNNNIATVTIDVLAVARTELNNCSGDSIALPKNGLSTEALLQEQRTQVYAQVRDFIARYAKGAQA